MATLFQRCRAGLVGLLLLAPLAACTDPPVTRGDMVEKDNLRQIVVGVHSKTDVAQALGSPSTISVFTDDVWYYIGAIEEYRSVFGRETLERRVVAVSFNPQGIVQGIEEYGSERGQEVDLVERETPSYGESLNVIQQMLGNVGRFNPEQANAPRR